MRKIWLITVIVFAVFFVTACNGNDPNETPNNTPEENNTNVPEENEKSPTTGAGMDNLELVEKISAEWALTGHANTGNPLNYAGTRDGCQPCHSGNGFLRHLTDDPFTPEADAEAGEDAHLPATMGCATCHTGAGKEMIDTGVTEGYVPFIDGAYDAGSGSAICISCHNGRRDTKEMYEQWASGEEKPTSYPHYDAGGLYSGQGGMEYPDVTYDNTGAHQSGGCNGCHMPETEDGYASHNFGMDEAYIEETCGTCHDGATDFTVGGNLQEELDSLLEELQEAAVATVEGASAIGTTRQTFPFVDENDEPVDINNVSTEAFVAAYNYYLIADDKSGGAHNPGYAKSLLEESLKKLQEE